MNGKLIKYSGKFDAYLEQGMGGFCATFHDDRGITQDEKFGEQHSIKWVIWAADLGRRGQTIEKAMITDESGECYYKGPLTPVATKKLRSKVFDNKLKANVFHSMCATLDYYFKELGFEKSVKCVQRNYKATLETSYEVDALKGKEKQDGEEKEVAL